MTPQELIPDPSSLVKNPLQLSLMLWGSPGIGKSNIVAEVAKQNGLELVNLRLSQLAPTDLRAASCRQWLIALKPLPNFYPPMEWNELSVGT